MRKLVACAVLGLSLHSALVHALPDWLIPSPFTIALQVGKWIVLQDEPDPVYYIQVQATAKTEEQARKQAFRLAVDQAVGSLLVSETEINNQSLTRHDVINYSSGYIHDFEYVNIHQHEESVTLQIDVWVKKSKIADRLVGTVQSDLDLGGEKISESFRSRAKERSDADQLLRNVLSDFPHKAFEHRINKIDYTDKNRNPVMLIHFTAQWNQSYVTSFAETLGNIGQPADVGLLFKDPWNMQIYSTKCYSTDCARYYNLENNQVQTINNAFSWQQPAVKVNLYSFDNKVEAESCGWYADMMGDAHSDNLYDFNGAGITLNADITLNPVFEIDLNKVNIDRLDRVVLEFTTLTECKKLLKTK